MRRTVARWVLSLGLCVLPGQVGAQEQAGPSEPVAAASTPRAKKKPHKRKKRPKRVKLWELGEAERQAVVEQARKAPTLPERLEAITRPLVGAPYVLSPLGEGDGPDPDPRFRWDAFDCTTFVESAMALALTDEVSKTTDLLDRIRYTGGVVGFDSRRHLVTTQWVPELIKDGFIEDITKRVGGKYAKVVPFELTDKRWKKRRIAKSLKLPDEAIPKGTFETPYIPIERMEKIANQVPPGTIINIVRMDVPWSPVLITHQGLVLQYPGSEVRWVRHASPVLKRVINEPLAKMMKRYQKPRKWKVIGANLQRIVPREQ